MRPKWQILVLSHQIGLRVLLRIALMRMQHPIDIVTTRIEAMVALRHLNKKPDLVIADLYLNDEPGLTFAADMRALHPQLPIMLIPTYEKTVTVLEEDLHTAAQLGVRILPKHTIPGSHSHNFHFELHSLLDKKELQT